MTAKVPTQEDLLKLDNYELKELSGGYWVGAPPCLDAAIMCGASLTESAVGEVQQKCNPPLYDVDGDGEGEYVLAVDWDNMLLEVIDYKNGTWVAKCYQIKEKPASPLDAIAQGIAGLVSAPLQLVQSLVQGVWSAIGNILSTLGTWGYLILFVIVLAILAFLFGR